METNTKVNGKITEDMDMEYIIGKMVKDANVNGKTIKDMAMEFFIIVVVKNGMKANGNMISIAVMEFIGIRVVVNVDTKDYLKMAKKMDLG
jgi:hypothetical protein